jgi:hypothetical protein
MSGNFQHHVLTDPESGQVLEVEAGTRLELQFRRRGLGPSRWHIEDRPSNLVPLHEDSHAFQFLVFRDEDRGPAALRLVRSRGDDNSGPFEVRDLTVLVSA